MGLTQVTAAGLTADLIDETKLADNSLDSEHYNDGSIDQAHLADEAINEAKLQISNAGSNGQFLSKQSGDTGGLTWADAGGGLSEVDMWVQSADGGSSGDFSNDVLLSADDLRVPDGARAASGFTKVGTGMTESAGIFTFPSTGTWEVFVRADITGSAAGTGNLKNQLSTNSGVAWTEITRSSWSAQARSDEFGVVNTSILTISNASTARFKATIWNSHTHGGLQGGSDPYRTYIIFKKLA